MGLSHSNTPPGPWNPLAVMKIHKHAGDVLTEYSRSYGPVFSFRPPGGPLTVVVNNDATIRQALLENADAFPYRITSPLRHKWGLRGRVFYSQGEDQKRIRAFFIKGLHDFEKKGLSVQVSEEARHLCDAFEKTNGEPFDPTALLSLATSNLMCILNFGQRLEYDDPKYKELMKNFDYLYYALTPNAPVQKYPWLYDTFYCRNLKTAQEWVKNYVRLEIDEHRKDFDPSNPRDFIDLYLINADKEKSLNERLYQPERGWYTIKDIFSSASNPGSAQVQWLIALFCTFPEEQDKVYEEILSVIGDSRLPSFDDMKSMPYTHAFLEEALRYRCSVPLGTREAARDVEIGGYTIPKGSHLLVNYWAAARDPDVWDKPKDFNPERFLSPDKKTVLKLSHHYPLGIGHRNCLGDNMAWMELFLFTTNLLQRFNLQFSPNDPKPPLKGVCGSTMVVEDFKLCAKKR